MREANPQIGKLESSMTAGYKQIQEAAAKGQSIHIAGDKKLGIKDVNISASKLLARARMDTLVGSSMDVTRVDPHTGQNYHSGAETAPNTMVTTFYRPAFWASSSWQTHAFKHEILHLDPLTRKWDYYPIEHQGPFDDAAESIDH